MTNSKSSLRLIFMGSPDFAVPTLKAIIDAGHNVVCVYVQPPRPAGRGQTIRRCPTHVFAENAGISVRVPANFRDPVDRDAFVSLQADAVVVAAYGLILPPDLLSAPALGCFNVHASLLPRWRGSAPIQRAILAGDKITGVTIMGMEKDLDSGPAYLKREVPISEKTTAQSLHDALAGLGGAMMIEVLQQIVEGSLLPKPQAEEGITYANKLKKSEGRIDWTRESAQIECQIRGLNPWPGVWFEFDGHRIKVLAAHVGPEVGLAGTVVKGPLNIACGKGSICIDRVQRSGRDPMDVQEFVRGSPIAVGTLLI